MPPADAGTSLAGVMDGCPASTGTRLGDAAIAATHSSSAGARTDAACAHIRFDKPTACNQDAQPAGVKA